MINQTSQSRRLDICLDYLYNKALGDKNLYESISAVRKAAGEVACAQNGQFWKSRYSDVVNRKLNEALTAMCCDPNCDTRNIQHIKTLIENYREMHNMPEVELDTPQVQVVAPSLQDELAGGEYDYDEVNDCDVENTILDLVEVGEYISFKAVVDELGETEDDKACLMDAMKELVRQGYLEVTQREPYNGYIEMALRIK